MDRLQSKLIVAIFLLLLLGCGQDQREEVTERYSTGEKKEVLTYEGQGSEEELVKRQIYARSGELIRVEDVAQGDTLFYNDINPDLKEPEGLKDFLADAAWIERSSESAIQFTDDSMYAVDRSGEGEISDSWIHHIEYSENEAVVHGDAGGDTVVIGPMGPDSLLWVGYDKLPPGVSSLNRVSRDVRQVAKTHRKQQQQRLGTAGQEIAIRPRGNQMEFEQEEITVPAGESVKLTFENTATSPSMQHNVVLLEEAPSLETFKVVGQAAVEAGASNQYVPDHPAVLASTNISRPGETVSVMFTAPSEPGRYGYVCTYPGHWATEHGTMQVVRE